MKKQKMMWAYLLVAVLCVCALAGCGNTADSGESVPEENYEDYENHEDSEESMEEIGSSDETEDKESVFIAEEDQDEAENEETGKTSSK